MRIIHGRTLYTGKYGTFMIVTMIVFMILISLVGTKPKKLTFMIVTVIIIMILTLLVGTKPKNTFMIVTMIMIMILMSLVGSKSYCGSGLHFFG